MPKEIRYLLFSTEEVLAALVEEATAAAPGMARDDVSFSIQMGATAQGGVALRVARRQRDGKLRPARAMQDEEVLALLLRLCRRTRVPLPLRGVKRVELVGRCLALSVTLNADRGEPRPVRGVIRHPDPDLFALEMRVREMQEG
jgi:hypothetical protein